MSDKPAPPAAPQKVVEKTFKEAKFEKIEFKEHKIEKLEKNEAKEHKDHKIEKLEKNEFKEHKDAKHEKIEKVEAKEHKDAKLEKFEHIEVPKQLGKEKDGKEIAEGPLGDPGIDPVDQRLAALEQSVAQMQHFITSSQRPDLSQGALSSEPDKKQR